MYILLSAVLGNMHEVLDYVSKVGVVDKEIHR